MARRSSKVNTTMTVTRIGQNRISEEETEPQDYDVTIEISGTYQSGDSDVGAGESIEDLEAQVYEESLNKWVSFDFDNDDEYDRAVELLINEYHRS